MDLLYIEDDPVDFTLLVRHLQRHGMEADVVRVDDPAGLEAALAARPWDAVLADYNVPGFNFRDVLARLKATLPDCPIILVSGSVGEEPAVELMREGIWDFVLKDNLARLCPAIERSIRDSVQRRDSRRAEQALQESEERFRLIAATVTGAIWMADVEHRQMLYVSPGYERIWQRSCASLYENPRSFLDSVHSADREPLLEEMRAARGSGRPYVVEYRVLRPDGSQRWVMGRGFPVASPTGRPERYVGVVEDVTERRQADERLRQAATVFESSREAVVIVDLDRRVLAVNKAFTDITGYTEAEASCLGSGFFDVVWAHLADSDQWQGEMWNRRKNGEVYPAWTSIATVRDDHGAASHHVAVFSDVSELKRNAQELARLAHYDSLTGLPNRLLLQSRLEHAIDRAGRNRQRAAVLFIDLDHFKKINESLGHVVGDQLLVDVAARLKSRVREEDTLGRFGSDEFLVVLEPLQTPDEAALLARDLLALLAEPFRLEGGKESFIGASIGISIFPDDGDSAAELLRDADTAKYQAKERGRNRFCFYTADMNLNAMAQLELEAALRRALERDEFVLYYQPKVDLASGRIVGAEALIRWQREGHGLESPARFIPLAERTGLIVPIGAWAIDEACRQLAHWRDAGRLGVRLAVNVSGLQFHAGDLVEEVARALDRHQIPANWLELELTESILMADPEQTITVLRELKALGVKLSLDDFGTGYSSLAYLSRFPIDALKIDRSFVRDIVTEPQAAMIAVSIIDLAHRMRLSVVAEGVETEPQLGYLRMRGCDEMQGYYFARPLPAAEFDAMVGAGRKLPAAESAAPPGGGTVLLVEADAAARSALATLLASAGYRVLLAEGWVQALETLATRPVQVVVADQCLPGMSGATFFRRVRDLHPATVGVMLAGTAERAAVGAAVEDGTVYGLLGEPWDGDALLESVRKAFAYHESVIRPRLVRSVL